MLTEDNLLVDIYETLKPASACIVESSHALLGESYLKLQRSLLSMDKLFKKMYSYLPTHSGAYVKTKGLSLSISDIKHQDLVKNLLTT